MTIVYKIGDLFSTTLPAFGHGVNIRGVMGSGFALLVKQKHPSVEKTYKKICEDQKLSPGGLLPIFSLDQGSKGMWVLNLASQDNPGPAARLEWVKASVTKAFEFCDVQGIEGFALPRIASDIGGLNWEDVKEVLDDVANRYPDVLLEVWSLPTAK